MNNLTRSLSAAAVLLLAGLTLAPSANAVQAIEVSPTSCGSSGDAWVYVCNYMHSHAQAVTLYRPVKPTPTTPVCPVNDVCVNVPQPLRAVEPYTTYVYYNHPHPQVRPNTGQIIEDVCDILDPTCDSIATTSLSADLTLVGWTDENADGVADQAVVRTLTGELVALDYASADMAVVEDVLALAQPVEATPAVFGGLVL